MFFDQNNKISLNTEKYEERVLILIDLLGFQDFINKNSCAKVRDFFEGLLDIPDMTSEGEISRERIGGPIAMKPAMTVFSDTIFMSFSIEYFQHLTQCLESHIGEENAKLHTRNTIVGAIGLYTGAIQRYALKKGFLTRGGVSFGKVFHCDKIWFGPAINEAHEYESTYANFPRVVMCPSIVEKLQINRDTMNTGLYIADDGLFSVDYLNFLHDFFSDDKKDYIDGHNNLRRSIEKHLKKAKLENKSKKAQLKWQWLANYFNRQTSKIREVHGNKVSYVKFY